jgi:hypothetical protein
MAEVGLLKWPGEDEFVSSRQSEDIHSLLALHHSQLRCRSAWLLTFDRVKLLLGGGGGRHGLLRIDIATDFFSMTTFDIVIKIAFRFVSVIFRFF